MRTAAAGGEPVEISPRPEPAPSPPEAPGGPPCVALPELDPPAPSSRQRPEEPLPRAYLDRPPLVARAEGYRMLHDVELEVALPPTKPAVVGRWQGRAPVAAAPRRLLLAGGAGLALVVGLGVAGAVWYGRRTAEPPPTVAALAAPTEPAALLEAVAAGQPDGPRWDGAPLVVTVEVKPATAAIRFDGRSVKGNQVEVRRDGRTHTVVVSAPGYVTQAQAFVPWQSGRLRVELRLVGER